MIDLHSHILPSIDDGAAELEASLAMARVASEDGVQKMVATPHVNNRYDVDPRQLAQLTGELNIALARAHVPLAVLSGAEVALYRLTDLDELTMRALSLGGSNSILVESPYERGVFIDDVLFEVELRGLRPVLGHPERCPSFQKDLDALEALIARGALATVNVGSLTGRFGETARRTAIAMLERGLVHATASDAHDAERRPPGLAGPLEAAAQAIPGLLELREWLTVVGPSAILSGDAVPEPPRLKPQRQPRWRRVLERARR